MLFAFFVEKKKERKKLVNYERRGFMIINVISSGVEYQKTAGEYTTKNESDWVSRK